MADRKDERVFGYAGAVRAYCLERGLDDRRARVHAAKDLRGLSPARTRLVIVYSDAVQSADLREVERTARARGIEVVYR